MKNGVINLSQILYLGFFPILLVDAINGWLIRSYAIPGSLSQLYKGTLLLVMFLWMAKHGKSGLYIVLSYIIITLCIIVFHTNDFLGLTDLANDLLFSMKLGMGLMFYLFLKPFFRTTNDVNWVELWFWRILKFSYFVVAVNIVLGVLGFGFTASHFGEDGYGGLGFFKAGNDLSSVFLVITSLLMFDLWTNKKTWKYFSIGFLSLLLSIFLQTKTVILGIGILYCAVPLIVSSKWKTIRKLNRRLTFVFLISSGIVISIVVWLIKSNTGVVQRFLYFYENSGLLFAILTGRSYFLEIALKIMTTKSSLMDFIWGHGWGNYLRSMAAIYSKEKLVEIDYVDVFMVNGAIGLSMVLAIWFWFLYQSLIFSRKYTVGRFVLFMNLLLLGIAGTAGHVFYSGLNGAFIAMLNALPWLQKQHTFKRVD